MSICSLTLPLLTPFVGNRPCERLGIRVPVRRGKSTLERFLSFIRSPRTIRDCFGRFVLVYVYRSSFSTTSVAYEGQSGSKDRGDPEVSVIQKLIFLYFERGASLDVQSFRCQFAFQRHGAILGPVLCASWTRWLCTSLFFAEASPNLQLVPKVKVMWPRGDGSSGPGSDMTASRRNRNAGLSGFVSFMKRKDAEVALRELDGFDWGGSVLRVGWSKAVPMAAKALYGAGPAILSLCMKLSPFP